MGSKRMKLEEENKGDRISDLPDSVIHHILSFLPSTKQAIQTSVLSKEWHKQWTHVPVLIFHSTGMSYENFLKFIDTTLMLHSCSKIKKFHLHYPNHDEKDPQFDEKIHFATRKYVEELNLMSSIQQGSYVLPKFVFNNASLVKLRTHNFAYMPDGKVNWKSLTELNMQSCSFPDQAMEHILSGSPLLKSLELSNSSFELDNKLVINSKSLKRLVLLSLQISDIEILCPNLQELSLNGLIIYYLELFAQAINNAVSASSLLESFELIDCGVLGQLVIVSKSLTNLSLGYLWDNFDIEISCPTLGKLKIFGSFDAKNVKLLNLPSSLCATVDCSSIGVECEEFQSFTKDILRKLQHVNELNIGTWFIKILSSFRVEDLIFPLFNLKCLTLNYGDWYKYPSGIAHVLRNSLVLEKLVINVHIHYQRYYTELNDFGEIYLNLNAVVFECLVSHLKTIKILGFPRRFEQDQLVPHFVRFLLKNAKVLEKMVVELNDNAKGYPFEVSQQELVSLPRCSQNASIELVCSK